MAMEGTANKPKGPEPPSLPTSNQDGQDSGANNPGVSGSSVGESAHAEEQSNATFSHEVQALKMKIFALEQHLNRKSITKKSDEKSTFQDASQAQARADTEKDEFDHEIDFCARRDRIRKNFEWDLDRLFLAEEVDKRKRKKANDKRDTKVMDKMDSAKPEPNRMDWLSFQRLYDAPEKECCVIDILIGEPSDDSFGSSRGWYGYADSDMSQAHNELASLAPGQGPLPERIRVHSLVLRKILADILRSVAGDRINALANPDVPAILFIRPFKALFYAEKALRAWYAALEKNTVEEKKDKEMDQGQGGAERNRKEEKDKDSDEKDTTKSRTAMVIGRDGKQAYRVVKLGSAPHRVVPAWQRRISDKRQRPIVPFSITCVYIDFDGKSLGPVWKTFEFQRFEGERDIISFPVYPLHFHAPRRLGSTEEVKKELESLSVAETHRNTLVSRGIKFLEAAGVKHAYYAGPTQGIRDEVESEVVVDFETAFSVEDKEQQKWKPALDVMLGNPPPVELGPNEEQEGIQPCRAACCANEVVHDDTYIDQTQKDEYVEGLLPKTHDVNEQPSVAVIPRLLTELKTANATYGYTVSDDERVIMPYRVFGFVLRSRKWAQLDLSHLNEVTASSESVNSNQDKHLNNKENKRETAFHNLVLEDGHKPMIVSLIAQHFRDKRSKSGDKEQVDIVKGKGKGLIFLLHGAPGVGKTSTAEGVAELFKKPLIQVTCGDLGTTAREVEKALEMNFAYANKWDCILLLDEADVFLAGRTKEEFVRNGLVAAFTSRIHVSLYYPELDLGKTNQVFKINLEMIRQRFKEKGRTIVIDEIENFASSHFVNYPFARWNGRQIRNACQTALALSEFEAQGSNHKVIEAPNSLVHLKISHFETVQKAYLEFTKYMDDLYGTNTARRAKEGKTRAYRVDTDQSNKIYEKKSMGGSLIEKRAADFLVASQEQRHAQNFPAYTAQQQQLPQKGPNSMSAPQQQHHQQIQMQQIPMKHAWNSPGANFRTDNQGQEEVQTGLLSQQRLPTTPPPHDATSTTKSTAEIGTERTD
ncbi:uncharacterized protein BCR38DRAFT_466837 [Pseudomassariella vexata]|uniref:AAA+ ATPase domain-containing protein n=1 Tax=Pseudomassariella vexata TaxID=1141098 RepID=A0A1Y2DSB6_9PEZI|nr:uncharacterized protein BCR38DRAFT_466837 [Pseudomassariella vexata]ORY62059.1 hypothetical protein BCR38DRAFT_466837 [Pseudomassariella vexata]